MTAMPNRLNMTWSWRENKTQDFSDSNASAQNWVYAFGASHVVFHKLISETRNLVREKRMSRFLSLRFQELHTRFGLDWKEEGQHAALQRKQDQKLVEIVKWGKNSSSTGCWIVARRVHALVDQLSVLPTATQFYVRMFSLGARNLCSQESKLFLSQSRRDFAQTSPLDVHHSNVAYIFG